MRAQTWVIGLLLVGAVVASAIAQVGGAPGGARVSAQTGAWLAPIGELSAYHRAVAADETRRLVFAGQAQRVIALDVSDPGTPILVGTSPPLGGDVEDLVVYGEHVLAAASEAGLAAVDVSDPTAPAIDAVLDTPGTAVDLWRERNTVFVADRHGGLRIVDVSNIRAPAEVGSLALRPGAEGVAAVDGYAYVIAADPFVASLDVVNIGDPARAWLVESIALSFIARDIAVDRDHAFVVGPTLILQAFDLSDPAAPVPAGKSSYAQPTPYTRTIATPPSPYLEAPTGGQDVVLSEGLAFIAMGNEGLALVDVSVPSEPRLFEELDTPGDGRGVAVLGRTAAIADGPQGVRVVDLGAQYHPEEVATFDPGPGDARSVAAEGGYAYIGDFQSGLRVVDVRAPDSPSLVGSATLVGAPLDVAYSTGYAYLALERRQEDPRRDGGIDPRVNPLRWLGGLAVVYVGDPGHPILAATVDDDRDARGVAVDAGRSRAYIAEGPTDLRRQPTGGRLQVVNVHNPVSPRPWGNDVGSVRAAMGVDAFATTAYVTDENLGLRVVDVSDPQNPRDLGFLATPGNALRVAANAPYAYVADGVGGLRIADVSAPTSPREVGALRLWPTVRDVALSGDLAVLAAGSAGVSLVDISDPTQPVEVDRHDVGGEAHGVFVDGDLVYVAASPATLCVLRIRRDARPTPPIADTETPTLTATSTATSPATRQATGTPSATPNAAYVPACHRPAP